MIFQIIIAVVMLLSMIFIHELGHGYYLNKLTGRKVKYRFRKGVIWVGEPKDYEGRTKKEYRGIYGYGILFGFLPSLFFIEYFKPSFFLLLMLAYLSGCIYDFKNIYKYGIRGDK